MQVEVGKIHVKGGRRGLDADYVKKLAESIRELGLLNPITVDKDFCLIAGLHRLEAVKLLGFTAVECMVCSLEGLQAEMAEIDENIVRNDLSAVEYGEILLRRKEIYDALHPETKATYEGGSFRGNQYREVVADKMSATTKSFVKDTAEKLGVDPRTVRRQIQTAKNLTPEAKEIMRDTDKKISKKAAMELSRLKPEQQKEAAELLTAGEIRSVGEYAEQRIVEQPEAVNVPGKQGKKAIEKVEEKPEKAMPKVAEEGKKEAAEAAAAQQRQKTGKRDAGLKAVVADLKNVDKDCSGTPESFLAEFAAFVRKFQKEIGWYDDPYYEAVFPCMDAEQLASLKEQTEAVCAAAERLFHKVERMMKK